MSWNSDNSCDVAGATNSLRNRVRDGVCVRHSLCLFQDANSVTRKVVQDSPMPWSRWGSEHTPIKMRPQCLVPSTMVATYLLNWMILQVVLRQQLVVFLTYNHHTFAFFILPIWVIIMTYDLVWQLCFLLPGWQRVTKKHIAVLRKLFGCVFAPEPALMQ